jgi:tellurite resistance protein
MANRNVRSSTTTNKPTSDYLYISDEEVMQALVTAGALVSLADGELKKVERDELVNFIDRQGFVPTILKADIADTFDSRVRELEGTYCANVIVETLRPLTGRSLASVVVRTAQRVAAADQKIHPGELQALKLIRRLMMSLPTGRPAFNMPTITPLQNSMECGCCGTVLVSPARSESAGPLDTIVIWHCPICRTEFEAHETSVEKKLSNELVRSFFPNLLVA